jgi:hypothetical protein
MREDKTTPEAQSQESECTRLFVGYHAILPTWDESLCDWREKRFVFRGGNSVKARLRR